ncbi:DUF4291 family protein [Nocardia panacis]|uniref:DUF4291 family protein n=1 Tax=Nocardia panacis TaxID=2340916 RepID=A0A3A4KGR1_9NOCA|nr:DUF4291 family protein [Nocardia panacis]RJO73659.1 DUF4291 family protein [Nocardia panacis]
MEQREIRADFDRETIVVYQAFGPEIAAAALGEAVLTSPVRRIYKDANEWRARFKRAPVHVQWDPEYALRGGKLAHRSIQVGLSRHIIERYVADWTVEIRDMTPVAHRMAQHLRAGNVDRAKPLLPPERSYPLDADLAFRVDVSPTWGE